MRQNTMFGPIPKEPPEKREVDERIPDIDRIEEERATLQEAGGIAPPIDDAWLLEAEEF